MTHTIKFVNFTLGAPFGAPFQKKSRPLPALYGSYAHEMRALDSRNCSQNVTNFSNVIAYSQIMSRMCEIYRKIGARLDIFSCFPEIAVLCLDICVFKPGYRLREAYVTDALPRSLEQEPAVVYPWL